MAKAQVTLSATSFAYDGKEKHPSVTVKLKKTDTDSLIEDKDFEVTYQGDENKGKKTLIITGIKKYTGTVKKTYSIVAADISSAEVTDEDGNSEITAVYIKGGATPVIEAEY